MYREMSFLVEMFNKSVFFLFEILTDVLAISFYHFLQIPCEGLLAVYIQHKNGHRNPIIRVSISSRVCSDDSKAHYCLVNLNFQGQVLMLHSDRGETIVIEYICICARV